MCSSIAQAETPTEANDNSTLRHGRGLVHNPGGRCGSFAARILACTLLWLGAGAGASAIEATSFQAGQGGWQMGTIAVGNVDEDAALEVIVPSRDTSGPRTVWFLDGFKGNGERLPNFPYAGGEQAINVSPTLYDLNGDGQAEIFFTCGNRVVALRGDGTVLWSTALTPENYVPDAGYQVVTNGFYWSADGAWRARLPETAQFFSEVSSPIVADTDGTGALQVLTAWKVLPDATSTAQDYNPFIRPLYGFGEWGTVGDVWSGGVVFFDATDGSKRFTYHIHQLVESGLGVGRARAGGAPLVYVLNDSDSVVAFDKTKPPGLWGKGMLHKQFGKNQRLQSGSYLKGVDVYPADIDGDGEDELLVPTTQLDPLWQPCETILDDDGAVLWRQWKEAAVVPVVNGWLNNACMIPVNPDRDNRIDVLSFTHGYEIAFRTWNGVDLVDRPGWPKDFHPLLPTPPVVGDVDSDGQEEIVIGTYDPGAVPSLGTLYVFALDGTEKHAFAVPGGLKHIPTLEDIQGDGALDIIYRSLDGQVHIRTLGQASSSRVSWATHRGNAQRDGQRNAALYPPGTPQVVRKTSGYRQVSFAWRVPQSDGLSGFEIHRAEQAEGPFRRIAQLAGEARAFTDSGLRDGCLYYYEVRAVYSGGTAASAPIAILSFLNNNLVANGGFEENDNSHWDKWFTGDIPWQNMTGSDHQPFQGRRSMEIKLTHHGNNSSIKQSNQYGTPEPAIRTAPGRLYSFGGWFRSGGLSQKSEHWLEWNTTRAGDNTDTIPPAPWPLYFTPAWVAGTEATPWTYANRVLIMPEGFPHVELRHRYTIASPGTGSVYMDGIFFRELPAPEDPRWQELIPFGAAWSYAVAPPPAAWFAPEFDDSSWATGSAKFGGGTGTDGINTALPLMQPAYYFRRECTLPSRPIEELLLVARATDDFNGRTYPLRLYLNGREVKSSGIDAVSGQGNTTRFYDLTPFSDGLRAGTNLIAVQVQNGWAADWDNVAFDLSLRAVLREELAQAQFSAIKAQPGGGVALTITAPAGSRWNIERADAPRVGANWQTVGTVVMNAALEMVSIPDPGSGGQRFYRLVLQADQP